MISILRKIRHKLLAQNKFTRYLVYAIGEIFLVVIGILIAVQINNRNEQRKSEQKAIEEVKALAVDLERDISRMGFWRDQCRSLEQYLRAVKDGDFDTIDPKPFLRRLTTNLYPVDYSIPYHRLKDQGLIYQLPDSLIGALAEFYEFKIHKLYEEADFHRTFVSDHIESFVLANYSFEPGYAVDSLSGYELMQDERLSSYINYQLGIYKDYSEKMDEAIEQAGKVLGMIDGYLEE